MFPVSGYGHDEDLEQKKSYFRSFKVNFFVNRTQVNTKTSKLQTSVAAKQFRVRRSIEGGSLSF